MTDDEQKQFARLEHHNAGLQQTVLDQGERIADQAETIQEMGTHNQELRDKVKELLTEPKV